MSLKNFIIGEKLGEGNFSTVRSAIHKDTGEPVAIKFISKDKVVTSDDKE